MEGLFYRVLADLTVLAHLAFILFAVFGALAQLKWKRMWLVHVPAAIWGAALELFGWYCPLTALENELRRAAGGAGYSTSFVEHYLLPVIYPPLLTPELQLLLAGIVLGVNAFLYAWVWKRRPSAT